MKPFSVLFPALGLLALLVLPVQTQAGSDNFYMAVLMKQTAPIYAAPDGAVVHTVTNEDQPRRIVTIHTKSQNGWFKIRTDSFQSYTDNITGYVPAGDLAALIETDWPLYTNAKMSAVAGRAQAGQYFYMLEYNGYGMLKGKVSDGTTETIGWVNASALTIDGILEAMD